MKHLLSMKQLTNDKIHHLFKIAKDLENGDLSWQAEGKFAANLFLEPSTRTKSSFHIAERKLGLDVLHLDGMDSSLTKGESLHDTLKTLEAIGADVAVVRQSEVGILDSCAENLNLSLINAGDGCGEHPTQSLLDLYTIQEQFEEFEGLHVAIAGDLKHSRVARSNAHALQQLGARVSFVTKPEWKDSTFSHRYITMDEAVEQCDVLMLLRIQHERHEQKTSASSYLKDHGLTKERESRMKDDAIILHPAPVNRGVEIDAELVESEKSRIFRQMTNGVTIRMAIIQALLKGEL
ncbi:aspartate carbamoyltransferase [Halobacillus halophilus]|uniref:Aspartate carbamoyltransferase n=1 Tax=Halobacillus halophilus (strain ATCC 35676 / DSM 2266 / JCM 20832 / KCTC 3685 / LMG 17431 / NBRC 102448 / NCIMB 2269) TaxID=866895 RepID=I0JM74_HALH3|nr:aspartate carbamoyltransferase catalytic subunit [Halobacillus halophilus]ASF39332.1 aspartate carbamoyltransferase [Halobacillus halophilus]CCG45244.1 aspartate carbamoyltransferase catalytic subunit [Halobacillus halophilus DSM 2266]